MFSPSLLKSFCSLKIAEDICRNLIYSLGCQDNLWFTTVLHCVAQTVSVMPLLVPRTLPTVWEEPEGKLRRNKMYFPPNVFSITFR